MMARLLEEDLGRRRRDERRGGRSAMNGAALSMMGLALACGLLLSACTGGEKASVQETGISAGDDSESTAETADSAPCESTPDTGRLNTCEDMDAPAPEDNPDLCDQQLPCVRSVKRCGTVEDQWAGWSLGSEMVGHPQLPAAAGDYGYEGPMAVYLVEDVASSGWLDGDVVIGGDVTTATAGFGHSIATGADLDGDSLPDLAVGAPYVSNHHTWEGAILIYDGPTFAGDTPEDPDANIHGGYYEDYLGNALAPVSDVNDDGYDELLAGVSNSDWEYTVSRFFLGPVGPDTDVDDAAAVWYSTETSPGDVTVAVDMTGDGVAELLLSDAFHQDRSAVWILDAEDRGVIDLADGSQGVFGTSDALILGWSMSAGDATGDGYADIVIDMAGQRIDDGVRLWGVVMAGPLPESTSVLSAVAQYEQFADEDYWNSTAVVGDVDGDGSPGDVLVAIPGTRGIHLLPSPLCGTYELDRHTQLTGAETTDAFLGRSIVPLPDVDGDGYDDVLIAAPFDDEGAPDAGAVYTLFGGSW